MAENLESGNGQGATGQPTPAASGAGSVSGTSGIDDALARRLEDALATRLEKRLQQMTDKRFDRVEKQGNDFRSFMEQVKPLLEKGMTIEQATREVELNDMVESYRQGRLTPGAPPAQAAQTSTLENIVTKAMQKFGLEATDPDVVSLMRETSDPEDRLFRLAELGTVRKTAPTPTPGSTPAPSGGTPPRPDLKAEYGREIAANRGNVKAISEIKKKYRDQGLDVW